VRKAKEKEEAKVAAQKALDTIMEDFKSGNADATVAAELAKRAQDFSKCCEDADAAASAKSAAEQSAKEKQAAASDAKEASEHATKKHKEHADELIGLEEALRVCESELECTKAAFATAKAIAKDAMSIEEKACRAEIMHPHSHIADTVPFEGAAPHPRGTTSKPT